MPELFSAVNHMLRLKKAVAHNKTEGVMQRINMPLHGWLLACVLVLAGCATEPADEVREEPVEKEFVRWQPLIEGSDLAYDLYHPYHPKEMKLSNGESLSGKKWDEFLKDYVEGFPVEKRDTILRGLTRFYVDYDQAEQAIRFEPLRYTTGPYSMHSYVSLVGTLTRGRAEALLKIRFYGLDWLHAHRIKAVADHFVWESPPLEFRREHSRRFWEYVLLDISEPEYRRLAEKFTSAEIAIIRFYGRERYSDLEVTERMKQDMEAMLAAMDAINGA